MKKKIVSGDRESRRAGAASTAADAWRYKKKKKKSHLNHSHCTYFLNNTIKTKRTRLWVPAYE